MSEYKEYIEEKQSIDQYFSKGYTITAVDENLSGMYIEFTSPNALKETILLTTAEARKYIATKMIYS